MIWEDTGFFNANWDNLAMIGIGLILVFLAIRYQFKPLLLLPLAIGIIIGNIPFTHGMAYQLGIYDQGSIMSYLFSGVLKGIYPALIFLGVGAMTDLSPLISNPKLMLLGAAAQVGIFVAFLGALVFGFGMPEAGAIAIIGGADGNTAIFLSSQIANGLKTAADAHDRKGTHRSHCHLSIHLHVSFTGNPALHHEDAYYKKRAAYPDETSPFRLRNWKNLFSLYSDSSSPPLSRPPPCPSWECSSSATY